MIKVPASRKVEIRKFIEERSLDELGEFLMLILDGTRHITDRPEFE